jgi:outer membrane protein
MKLILKFFVLIFLMAESKVGASQALVELTLKDAQDYAIKNAFSVKTTGYDAMTAKLKSDALLGTGLPQISGSLQYNNYINIPTQLLPAEFLGGRPGDYAPVRFGVPQNVTAGISATQILFNGTWLVGLQASKAYASLQEKNVSKSHVDIKNNVAQTYYVALISQRNSALLKQSREVLSKSLEDTRQLLINGFVEEQDVEQLQLTLADLEIKISNADQQVGLTMDMLKFTMGMPIETQVVLKEDADALVSENSLEFLNTAAVLDNNIDVLVVQDALKMQELNLKAERSKLLPSAAAFYNLQAQAQRQEFNFFDTSKQWFPIQLWGLQISVPIFSGMSNAKNIQIAKVQLQQSQDLVNFTKQSKQLEYNNARSAYRFAFENYNNAKSSMELSNRILDKTRIKYKEGVSSSFEVAQIQGQALTAQGQYIGAMINLLNAKTAMQKILNQL